MSAFKYKILKRALFRSSLFFFLVCFFFVYFIHKAVTPELPRESSPLVFYSTPSRQDLKLTLSEAIRSAKHSLFASFYGVTDRDIIAALACQASKGIAVQIEYDPTASLPLKNLFPPTASIKALRSKGLMHRKILIVDQSTLFLGSANLTPSSLRHHSNCLIGLYCPSLAAFLLKKEGCQFAFSIMNQKGEMWLLPDTEKRALIRLLTLINQASKTIRIAMFTLTHPEIAQALTDAIDRGVHVSIIVDYYSARGASQKTVQKLHQAGARIFLSQGPELFHHKWAIVDDHTFAMGSANWTKAAFSKNEDFLLILSSLTKDQNKYLNHLWRILELETNDFL